MGVFKFKKFSVCDDRASMKVGTDGVLLGAWADVQFAKNMLDIGTGSGVIALMLAQRSTETARIDAVELMKADAQQAMENAASSPWPEKVSVVNAGIQDFFSTTRYDLIVCNPPFFSKSLLPPNASRSMTRHDRSLTTEVLLTAVVRLLTPEGRCCIILPVAESEAFIRAAASKSMMLRGRTRFFTRDSKLQERSLLEFARKQGSLREDVLILYESGDRWTEAYRKLVGDFYLEG